MVKYETRILILKYLTRIDFEKTRILIDKVMKSVTQDMGGL